MTEEKQPVETNEEFASKVSKKFAKTMKQIEGGSVTGRKTSYYSPFSESLIGAKTNSLSGIDHTDVSSWLESPAKSEKQLRQLSNLLYNVNGEYRGMVNYYVNLARFYHYFDFKGDPNEHAPNKLKKEIRILTDEFSKMNVAHEFSKVFHTMVLEDVFYGYEITDKHSYFLMKLDPDYCRLAGQSDGMWIFEFDFSYFDSRRELLSSYPPEFESKYNIYSQRESKVANRWQQLSFDKSVVYKFNETQYEIVPPLSVAFEGILDLNEYKGLKKVGAKIDNYLILHQKVPMFKDTDKSMKPNNFMITSDTMEMFHNMLDMSLPDEIGAVVSPMEIEPIQLDKSREPSDKVAEATRDVYNSVGINQYLFNPDKNSTAGLSKSIGKDEALVVGVYPQFERWLNRKLKIAHPKWGDWLVKLVTATKLSEQEHLTALSNVGTLGLPVVGQIAAMLSITSVDSMAYLENEVLELKDKLIPLASSHTGGIQDAGGRPTLDDDKISDSGQANRDSNEGVAGGEK